MSRRKQFRSSVGCLVHDSRGAVGVLFGLMLVPLIGGVGVAIDYARMVQFKADLQSIVDQSALAGATVFVDATAGTAATTAATNYFNSAYLPSYISLSAPTIATSTTGTTNFGSTAFTVKVSATAKLKPSFLTIWTKSLSVAAVGTAGNPQVNPTFKTSAVRASACDGNTIYLYQVPLVGGVPSYTTVPAFTTGAKGNYWEIGNNYGAALPAGQPATPPGITTNVLLGFALENVVNGNCKTSIFGANSYGAPDGATQWFYSSFLPAGNPPTQNANYNYNATVTESNPKTGSPAITAVTTTVGTSPPPIESGCPSGTTPCQLVQYTGGASTASGTGTTACKTTSLQAGKAVTLNCATQYPTGSAGTPDMSLYIQEGTSVTAAYLAGLTSTSAPPAGTAGSSFSTSQPWSKFGAVTCAGISQLSANSAVYWWNDGGGESPGAKSAGVSTVSYTPGAGDDHDYNDAFYSITCTLAIGGSGSGSTEVVLID